MNSKYQEALDEVDHYLKKSKLNVISYLESRKDVKTLQELVSKYERLYGHVELAIKMLEGGSEYAIGTLKEGLEDEE